MAQAHFDWMVSGEDCTHPGTNTDGFTFAMQEDWIENSYEEDSYADSS